MSSHANPSAHHRPDRRHDDVADSADDLLSGPARIEVLAADLATHLRALVHVAILTDAGIGDVFGLLNLRAGSLQAAVVSRQKERARAERFRAVERDLAEIRAACQKPTTPATVHRVRLLPPAPAADSAGSPPSSARTAMTYLIELRAWNLRENQTHLAAARRIAGDLAAALADPPDEQLRDIGARIEGALKPA